MPTRLPASGAEVPCPPGSTPASALPPIATCTPSGENAQQPISTLSPTIDTAQGPSPMLQSATPTPSFLQAHIPEAHSIATVERPIIADLAQKPPIPPEEDGAPPAGPDEAEFGGWAEDEPAQRAATSTAAASRRRDHIVAELRTVLSRAYQDRNTSCARFQETRGRSRFAEVGPMTQKRDS